MQGIIQKKLASISRTLPLAIFDKKMPFFLKIVLFKTFLGNTSHKVQDWECINKYKLSINWRELKTIWEAQCHAIVQEQ